jgi:2-hydroxychromene-2-carboxylate isomerase
MRGAIAALQQKRFAAYHPAMYRAVWSEGRNLGKEEALRDLLQSVGIDPASIDGDEIKNELRANTDQAVARGAFGAPTFFVNGEMFWGNDRLEFVEAALKRAA